jgi:hypothetical protein
MDEARTYDGAVYESRFFDLGVRAVSQNLKTVKVFTGRNACEMDAQVSFDSAHVMVSAAGYFLGSLVGGMMLAILEHARREHLVIEEIEAKLRGCVEHPLSLLGVRGYEQTPTLTGLQVDFYIYAEVEEEALQAFCLQALERSLVYTSVKTSLPITMRFKLLL